ncbi:MAG: FmdE family protein [Desulfobulbaceae bacterium]|nr:FmdE family protein [Desulfobulbaceae bacterium]
MDTQLISAETIKKTIEFHGHSCPGLAIGIRASEVALSEFSMRSLDEEIVAVTETNMCGVDAIQYLTGCTLGKGNLIHLDYGKKAFSFYRRSDEKGIRIVLKSEFFKKMANDMLALQKKRMTSGLNPEEQQGFKMLTQERITMVMEADRNELFDIQEAPGPLPIKAKILQSVTCSKCGEETMETKTRLFLAKNLCIPCFNKVHNHE